MKLSCAITLTALILVGGCASGASPPTSTVLGDLEWCRVLAPGSGPTAAAGRRIVEFAPEVQTRSVHCAGTGGRVFECVFDSRVKQFGGEWTEWQPRRELVRRGKKGWEFARGVDAH